MAVELHFEELPVHVVPALCQLTPPQRRAFELLGLRPHQALRLSPPTAA